MVVVDYQTMIDYWKNKIKIAELQAENNYLKQQLEALQLSVTQANEKLEKEVIYARELVNTAMMRGGMWPIENKQEEVTGGATPWNAPNNTLLPLWKQAEMARADEELEYLHSLSSQVPSLDLPDVNNP